MARAGLLALGLALLAPLPVLGQAADLVSNLDETASALVTGKRVAQAFTTGDNIGGYDVTGIRLHVRAGTGTLQGNLVTIHLDDNGRPGGNIVATFATPSGIASTGTGAEHSFEVTGGLTRELDANTKYWVVINGGLDHRFHTVAANGLAVSVTDSEDETGAEASLDPASYEQDVGDDEDWSVRTGKVLMALEGGSATDPTPAPIAGGVLASTLSSRVSELVTDKKIAYAFATGRYAHGYDVTGIRLHVRAGTGTLRSGLVRIHEENAEGEPGALVATLANPSGIASTGTGAVHTFTAPPFTRLEPRTGYMVTVNDGLGAADSIASVGLAVSRTSNSQFTGTAVVLDTLSFERGLAADAEWSLADNDPLMSVQGRAVTAPGPPAGVMPSEDEHGRKPHLLHATEIVLEEGATGVFTFDVVNSMGSIRERSYSTLTSSDVEQGINRVSFEIQDGSGDLRIVYEPGNATYWRPHDLVLVYGGVRTTISRPLIAESSPLPLTAVISAAEIPFTPYEGQLLGIEIWERRVDIEEVSVRAPPGGRTVFGAADSIFVDVRFSGPVTTFAESKIPIGIGEDAREAILAPASNDGDDTLTFFYVSEAEEEETMGGGVIVNEGDNGALSLPGAADAICVVPDGRDHACGQISIGRDTAPIEEVYDAGGFEAIDLFDNAARRAFLPHYRAADDSVSVNPGSYTVDTLPPRLVEVTAAAGGRAVVLTFSEALAVTTPPKSAFRIVRTRGGVAAAVPQSAALAPVVSGRKVTLGWGAGFDAVAAGDEWQVGYTGITYDEKDDPISAVDGALEDLAGNFAPNVHTAELAGVLNIGVRPNRTQALDFRSDTFAYDVSIPYAYKDDVNIGVVTRPGTTVTARGARHLETNPVPETNTKNTLFRVSLPYSTSSSEITKTVTITATGASGDRTSYTVRLHKLGPQSYGWIPAATSEELTRKYVVIREGEERRISVSSPHVAGRGAHPVAHELRLQLFPSKNSDAQKGTSDYLDDGTPIYHNPAGVHVEYDPPDAVFRWAAGDTEPKTVTIRALDNDEDHPDRRFVVDVVDPGILNDERQNVVATSRKSPNSRVSDEQSSLRIVDDEPGDGPEALVCTKPGVTDGNPSRRRREIWSGTMQLEELPDPQGVGPVYGYVEGKYGSLSSPRHFHYEGRRYTIEALLDAFINPEASSNEPDFVLRLDGLLPDSANVKTPAGLRLHICRNNGLPFVEFSGLHRRIRDGKYEYFDPETGGGNLAAFVRSGLPVHLLLSVPDETDSRNSSVLGSIRVSGKPQVGEELTISLEDVHIPNPDQVHGYRIIWDRVTDASDDPFRPSVGEGGTVVESALKSVKTQTFTIPEASLGERLAFQVNYFQDAEQQHTRGEIFADIFPRRGRIVAASTAGPALNASGSSVNAAGDTVTLAFSEALDQSNRPAAGAFDVSAGERGIGVMGVSGSGSSITLAVYPKIRQGETVFVSYYDPTSGNDGKAVQNAGGTDAGTFEEAAIANNSTFSMNTVATGAPVIAGTGRIGDTLTASRGDIADGDGLERATFAWEWFHREGARDRAIRITRVNCELGDDLCRPETGLGATLPTYVPKESDLGKLIGVRAIFRDDAEFMESRASVGAVAVRNAIPETCPAFTLPEGQAQLWSGTVTVGTEELSGTALSHGYVSSDSTGSLDTTAFDLPGPTPTTTVVSRAVVLAGAGQDPEGALRVTLSGVEEDGVPPSLLVHDCGDSYALGEAAYAFSVVDNVETHTYTWKRAGLDWSGLVGATRTLRITRPKVTIEADRPKASGGSDWIHYTLTRTGSVGHEAAVTVNLAGPAGNDWGLDADKTSREAVFAAGSAKTVLSVRMAGGGDFDIGYEQAADFDGALTASVAAQAGFETAGAAASVEVVAVPAPRWFGRVVGYPLSYLEGEHLPHRFQVEVYAASPDMPAPSSDQHGEAAIQVRVSTEDGTATGGDDDHFNEGEDYKHYDGGHLLPAPDFRAGADGVQRSRFSVTFTSYGDQPALVEGDETLSIKLSRTQAMPEGTILFDVPGGTRAASASYPVVLKDFDFGVLDVAVTSTPGASADTYGVGDEIRFTVTFSRRAWVDGAPHFEFSLGGTDKAAAYRRGHGTRELEFAYTVLAADMDDDGIWIGDQDRTIKLDAGESIRGFEFSDGRSRLVDATLDHDAPGTQGGHKVDGSMSPAGAPTAPVGLEAGTLGSYRVDLAWTEPSSTGGSAITGYKVERSADGGSTWTEAEDDTESADTAYSDTGVAAETTYTYRVSAINTQGTGPASETAEVSTGPPVPGAPTGLSAAARDKDPADLFTEIELAWTAPANVGGSAITGYRIEWSADGSDPWRELEASAAAPGETCAVPPTAPASGVAHCDDELPSQTRRFYRVSAINDEGASLPSGSASTRTADILGPVPEEVTVSADGRSVDVDFDEEVAEFSFGIGADTARLFEVTADGAPVAFGSIEEVLAYGERYPVLANLSPAIKEGQAVVVTYTNPTSNADPSDDIHAFRDLSPRQNEAASFVTGVDGVVAVVNNSEVAPVAPDAVPTLEVAQGGDGRSLALDWDAPPYSGGAPVESYRIEVSADGGTTFAELVAAHDETDGDGGIVRRYVHEDLQPGAVRHYRVAARNRVGLGDPSDSARGELERVGQVSVAFDLAAVSEGEPLFVVVTATVDGNVAPGDGLPMEIRVTTAGGTAGAPEDYEAVDETVRFEAKDFGQPVPDFHQATKRVRVTVVDDLMVEGRETLSVSGEVASGGRGWALVREGVVTETSIHDDDAWAVRVEADPASVAEGETRAVELTARIVHVDDKDVPSAPDQGACVVPFPVTVGLDVGGTAQSGGVDYTLTGEAGETREFAACSVESVVWQAELEVAVDREDDGGETVVFAARIEGTPETAAADLGDEVAASVALTDEPGVVLSVGSLLVDEGDSGTYTVALTAPPEPETLVNVTLSLSERADGTGAPDPDVTLSHAGGAHATVVRLAFTEENWNRPQTVTVRAAHDPDGDYDEAWVSHRVTGPAGFAGLAVPRMRIGVRDDETSYGELRAEFTGVSQRDPAPATHRGETFRIALHWSLPRTPHHWENPWPALGPGGAVRVTGATVRPVHTPGFGRFTGHALVLEFTPDGPGTDVTLTLLQMDCARVAGTDGPNPKALCGVLRDGGTRYTGLAGRQRWTVRGLEGLAAVTSVGLVSDPGPDRRYTAGDTIRAEVAMSRAVHRDGAAPTLALDIGEVRREMALADWPDAQSGTARDTLAFAYRVVAEDRDLDGLAIPAGGLALNGGTLTDPDDLLRAPYVRLERERRFPSHLVQGVIPRVVKVQRHRNRVWVHFDRDFAPLLDGNGMTEDQFRVRYSVSKNWLHDVTDARVVRGRGWAHQCGRGAAGCRVVRLTLGEVRRHKAPETGDERTLQIHGAPLADETVEIFYAPNPYPHFEKYRLRDAHDNPVVPFGPVEAVLLAAGDNPVLSVSDARGWESIAHLMTLHFHVRLVPAATVPVTVSYETREGVVVGQRVELRDSGTATHDVDYEGIRPPRTLVFAPGETQKTVTVKIIDDGVQDPGEVFALVLTEPSGAAPGDMVGQGTIHNDEELTAAFAGMPESHDGATPFMFGLEFNTPVTADAATVRGALRVTGAAVTGVTAAPAEGEPAGKRFRVSVTPSGGAAVRLRIVATPECAASGAVCTADGVGLDAATAPPVPYGGAVALRVSGVAQAGRALAAALAPVGVEAAWQWLRGAEEIAGATGATYTPAAADVGARLSVRATLAGRTGPEAALVAGAAAPVWPAAANPPLALGEEELLSAVLTLGLAGTAGSGDRVAGWGRRDGRTFGALDRTSFEHGGAARALARVTMSADCAFALETGTRLADPSGLVAYWNGVRIGELAHAGAGGLLSGRAGGACAAHLRALGDAAGGSPDGVRVALSLRRALPVVRVRGAAVTSGPGANGRWDAGERVEAELRFGAPVTVAGGAPALALVLDGEARRAAALAGGSGTDRLTFSWTVPPSDAGAKRVRVAANGLDLAGGRLAGNGGEAVDTAFAVAPWVTAVAVAPDASFDRQWSPGETVEVRLAFSEAVTVAGGSPRLAATVAGLDQPAVLGYASGSGGRTLAFSTEVPAGAAPFTGVAAVEDSLEANGAAVRSAATGLAADLRHDGTEPVPAPGAGALLTAAFAEVPASHGGVAFELRLRFGEALALGWETLSGALEATGATVDGARRARAGDDREWRIAVTPDRRAREAAVTLRARPCTEAGAICTGDGRALAADVAATVPHAVAPAARAFEAELVELPGEHDGAGDIVFELAFTKRPDPDYGFAHFRDGALRIHRGEARLVPALSRLNRRHNDRWRVTVAPGGREDVRVRVGPFETCSDEGAVCTGNGEVLANAVDETVPGPPGLSGADARGRAGAGETADFAVTLARASAHRVTVDYATSDGTGANAAVAGADYESRSGTLAFEPGETQKTVAVALKAHGRDEGERTFRLALSNPQGANAWLADAEATGTVGPMPKLRAGDGRGMEGAYGNTVAFEVALAPADPEGTVTVNWRTADGTGADGAVAGADYESRSGTLAFGPGETSKTVTVRILDDGETEGDERFRLVLDEPSGAVLADGAGEGLILDHDPLRAAFPDAPQAHDGAAFTLALAFTRAVRASAQDVGAALSATGATVTAVIGPDGDARRFEVTVEPDGTAEVTVRLAAAPDCAVAGAVCTPGGLGLEFGASAAVAYGAPLAAPSIAGVPQVGQTLAAGFDETPEGTLAWQWLRGEEEIAGAEAATYVPVAADAGAALSVRAARGAATAVSAPTAPVWPAPASAPLAPGEEELLSTVLTLGASAEFPLRMGGYNRLTGTPFGAIDEASFRDGGAGRTVELLMVNELGVLTVAADAALSRPGELAAYWNGRRIAGLRAKSTVWGHPMLSAASGIPRETYLRYAGGEADGVRVAVSLRRAAVRVTGVSVTSEPGENGTWDEDEPVEAELRFSAPVTVTGGPPALRLTLDGAPVEAAYAGGSGTEALIFSWTVTEAEAGARRARVAANGFAPGGAALAGPGGLRVDTGFAAPPWVTGVAIVSDASGDREWTAGETIEARVAFSEPVTVADGAPWLEVSIAGFAHPVTLGWASGSGSETLAFSAQVPGGAFTGLSVVADSLVANGAAVVSAASGLAADLRHDGTAPTAPPGEGDAAPLTAAFADVPASHGGKPFTLRLRFGEGTVFGTAPEPGAFTVAGGAVTAVARTAPGDGTAWEVAVTPDGASADVTVTVPARACGQAGAVCTADGRGLAADVSARVPGEAADAAFEVRLVDVPAEHDGATPVVFEVAFTKEPVGYSYRTMRDATLDIRRGGIRFGATRARRLDRPRNHRWEITVVLPTKEDLTVSIGPFSSCTETGAVCAANEEVLANEVEKTILGPPGLSVADARVDENTGDPVAFAVTLGRASRHTVTVDYATSDGTGANAAVAGEDYEETSGTLTFAPGETQKTVSVPVLPDSHDEGEETFTLTLSNPQGGNAWLEDAVASGTIVNTDAMPRAWLARLGRTVAEQVLEAVEGRFAAPRRPGMAASVAGHTLGGSGAGAAQADDARARKAGEEAQERDRLEALTKWLRGEAEEEEERRARDTRAVTPRDLLTGSSFSVTGAAHEGGQVSLWGRSAVSAFDGRDDDLTLSGEVTSVMLGADWAGGPGSKAGTAPAAGRGAWTAGLLVSRSAGEGSWRGPDAAGEVESTLTGLYPYGRLAASERVTLWGVAGYGAGELVLTPEGAGGESRAAMRTGMDLAMAAVGLRGVAVEAPADGGVELAVKSDALGVRTTSERAGGLAAAEADVTRLRLGLEGSWRGLEAGGGTLAPTAEIGLRHDGGDAETGFGLDLGLGLSWSAPESGLAAEFRGRGLLTRESEGFRDRGLSGSLSWEPGRGSGLGPKLALAQTAGGAAAGGMDALLGQRHLGALAANDPGAGSGAGNGDDLANRRLELELGYGFSVLDDRGVATPWMGLSRSATGQRWRLGQRLRLGQASQWRLESALGEDGRSWEAGYAYRLGQRLEVSLDATRRESAGGSAPPQHEVGFRVTARW